MWLDFGLVASIATLIDEELAKRAAELEDVKIRMFLPLQELQVLKADPEQEHFILNDWFFGKITRRYHDMGCCHDTPFRFVDIPRLYREFLKVDIAFVGTTPMDSHGYFNFGTSISHFKAL